MSMYKRWMEEILLREAFSLEIACREQDHQENGDRLCTGGKSGYGVSD